MKKEQIVQGAKIAVKNGKAVYAFVESLENKTPMSPFAGRVPFCIWKFGSNSMDDQKYIDDGVQFEIVLAQKKKKVVYKKFDCSSQFVALKRISDGQLYETWYTCVKYDAVLL